MADNEQISLRLKDWAEPEAEEGTRLGAVVSPADIRLDCPDGMAREEVLHLLERAVAFMRSIWGFAEKEIPDIGLPLEREAALFLINQLHLDLLVQRVDMDDEQLMAALRGLMNEIGGVLGGLAADRHALAQ